MLEFQMVSVCRRPSMVELIVSLCLLLKQQYYRLIVLWYEMVANTQDCLLLLVWLQFPTVLQHVDK